EVKQVQLTTRRIGTQLRRSVQVTANLPEPERKLDGFPVSVVVGWGAVPDGKGAIRVARVSSALFDITAEPVPHDLRDVVVAGDRFVDVVVPAAWRLHLEHYAA